MRENGIGLIGRQGPSELRRHCNHSLSAQADRKCATEQGLSQETPDTPILPLRAPKPVATPESEMGAAVILSNIREKEYLRATNVIAVANPSDASNELPSTVRIVSCG